MEKTVFLSLTLSEQQDYIAKAIVSREAEIFSYEINITNYERIIADPATSESFRKQLSDLLITENRERDKCVQILESLKSQIPVADLQAKVAAAKIALAP